MYAIELGFANVKSWLHLQVAFSVNINYNGPHIYDHNPKGFILKSHLPKTITYHFLTDQATDQTAAPQGYNADITGWEFMEDTVKQGWQID